MRNINLDFRKILVIDDDEINVKLISLILMKNNFQVFTALSGESGYALALSCNPDLILLDIMMPDIDGYEVCKILKENKSTSDIPVIFLTASNDPDSMIRGFESGAVDYVTKPFSRNELLARVNAHLKLRITLEEIEESESSYKMLFNNMTNGFVLHKVVRDENGVPVDYEFIRVNPAFEKLTGFRHEDVIYKSLKTTMPNTQETWIKNYTITAETAKAVNFEYYSKEIDKYFEVIVFTPDRIFYATILSDVTQKRKAELKLIEYNDNLEKLVMEKTAQLSISLEREKELTTELQRALDKEKELGDLKTRFVSMASHELKTPLTTIMSSCDILLNYRNKYTEDKIESRLRGIKGEVIHMTRMIEDVLHMSRPFEKEKPLNVERIKIRNFIDTLIFDFLIIDENKHNIIVECSNDIEISTDPVRLKMIITNLISNAIKYSPESAEIRVKCIFENGSLSLSIRDFGIGIPPEHRDKIFEPFHRFENVGTIKGTGLGLSITKREVYLLGGEITYNDKVDSGTEFIINIPDKSRTETTKQN